MHIDDDVSGPAGPWPLAVLLTDDRAGAEALVTAALAGRHREPAGLRRAVAVAALDSPDAAAPPPAASALRDPGAEALTDALRALPRAIRTLAVVSLLDPATASTLGGTPAEAVAALRAELARQDARQRAERERFEAPFRAPGSPPPPSEPDRTPLPDRLRALAARTPLSDAQAAALDHDADDRRRDRRRARRRVLAAVLVLAGLVALVRVVPWPGEPVPPVDVFAGPTRGSLAGDAAFLAELRDQSWAGTDLATEPPPPSRRVVWADDVEGGRAALVVSGEGIDFAAAWFAGPPGAAPRGMRVQAVQLGPDRTLPVALAAPVSGALVVVGAPGDQVTVSPRPEVTAGGSVTRSWSPAETVDGVAAVTLQQSTRTDSPAVRFRVTRADRELPAGPVDVVTESDPGPPWLPRLRNAPGPAVGDTAVNQQLQDLLGRLGQRADISGTTVLWAGDLPGRDARTVRTAVVAVPQPSGAVVLTAPFGYARDLSGQADSSTCVTGVLPSGPPLAQRVVALRCAFGAPEPLLLVVAPRGADRVRLLDAAGEVLDDRAMDDGVAVVTSPGLVTGVEVDTPADGTVSAPVLQDADLRG
ncbi:hypothetical protein KUM42_19850 [Modestobacter sp. L9-4]|uniref:hypothetical protein n=1 Tax=Modestobacter sp. L9-4 TaxID=2851567 RepID=UPI001C73F945|nr:hypothetical protein [Modestobacter sp. L9-4]QXG75985.1 hypothetical protein KUM42_19850 [Modestobacter sp. L9-4]